MSPVYTACGEGAIGTNVTLQYRGGEVGPATVHNQLSLKLSALDPFGGKFSP